MRDAFVLAEKIIALLASEPDMTSFRAREALSAASYGTGDFPDYPVYSKSDD